MRRELFPGTFDPPTNGHLDILRRASALFDEVIVAVAVNPEKNPVLDPKERMRLLSEISKGLPNVKVASFEGLAAGSPFLAENGALGIGPEQTAFD